MESKKTVRVEAPRGTREARGALPWFGQRFATVRRLGEGNMGVVYEAVDRPSGTRVALKTLANATPAAIYHFKNEFRALADLVHPNLVTLHELIAESGTLFFTMELVNGLPFDDHVRVGTADQRPPCLDGDATLPLHPQRARLAARASTTIETLAPPAERPLDEARLRAALAQLAAGVVALHDAGKLHRDLKPSNVLVTRAGEVKIVDFGLVSDGSEDAVGQTMHDRVVGTPAYMAPEQAAGERASEASDWYAVGVMLYEVLTGRLPFEGSLTDILQSKQLGSPVPPRQLCHVPADLEALCLAMLACHAHERPSGAEICAALQAPSSVVPMPRTRPDSVPLPLGVGVPSGVRQLVPFVGREPELEVLRATLKLTERGEPWVVHLTGASGMGKSALAARFLELASLESDAVVLRGRCFERESVPYKGVDGVIDALSRHLRRLPPRALARLLPRNLQALRRLFPVLARIDAVANAPPSRLELPLEPAEQRRLAWSALRELLGRVADATPLVVCIDDFQWADPDSAQLLAALLAPPHPPPLLLLLGYRSDAARVNAGLSTLDEALAVHAIHERRLELAGLQPAQVAELVETLSPPGRALDAQLCWRESEGNPFLVHELLRQAQRRTPSSGALDLDQAVGARLRALPEDARKLLQLTALAARPTPIDVLALAADVGDARGALRRLEAAHLVRSSARDPTRVETYHDRLRVAVVRGLGVDEQRLLHARLAQALLEHDGDPETLVEHFLAAGDPERALSHLLRAAPRAADALAFDRAARCYRLAAELAERVDPDRAHTLRLRHADALASAGRCLDAAAAYEQAACSAEPDAQARLRLSAATQLLLAGRAEQGMAGLERALSGYGLHGLADDAAALDYIARTLPQCLELAARFDLGRGFATEAELGAEVLTRLDVVHASALGLAWLDMGPRYLALSLADARGSLEAREPLRVVRAGSLLRSILASIGQVLPSTLLSVLDAACAVAQDPRALAWSAYGAGASTYFHSNFHAGANLLEQAEALFRERCRGATRELALVRIPLIIALRWAGRWREAMAACRRWESSAREQGDTFIELWMQLLDFSALIEDDPERARRRVAAAHGRLAAFVARSASASTATVVRIVGEVRAAENDWYEGRYERAHGALARLARELEPAGTTDGAAARLPLHAMQQLWHRCRAFCGLLAERGALDSALAEERQQLIAEHAAYTIATMSTPNLLAAAVARLEGRSGEAGRLLLEEARYAERVHGNAGNAAALRLKAGVLLGGNEGAALCARADSELRAMGVRDPGRWANVIAPGL